MRALSNVFLLLGMVGLAAVMSANLYRVMLTSDPAGTLLSEPWWVPGWPVSVAALTLIAAGIAMLLAPSASSAREQLASRGIKRQTLRS